MTPLLGRPGRMSCGQLIITCLFILVCMGTLTDCLLCYQCATSGPVSPCISDYEGLLNTSLGITNTYLVNCTATKASWDRCMIETAEFNGGYVLYHRGCHDGKTFQTDFYSERFENLPPNNFTTCDQVGNTNKLICYRFCNTDFCNGPQKPPNNTDPVCEAYYENPYDVTLPPGKTCGAGAIFTGKGPMSLELLCLLMTWLLVIGWAGSA